MPVTEIERVLADYVPLQKAALMTGYTAETLRMKADRGLIRSVRDLTNRRLLWRKDVEKIAAERAK